jgi:3',5'-nucleoside bisphosphate phosphatase
VFTLDTHLHTCLSPCGELDMHPAAVVAAAISAGIDGVAVCDHNSAENVAAVERAGRRSGLGVIPGMEITSAEEVHILGLLPDVESALALQSVVYRDLPGRNDERAFGMQVIANEFREVLGFNEHLLSGATTMPVEAVVGAIHRVKGIAVASHVDRECFGIIGQLGMIPPGLQLDALEVSRHMDFPGARVAFSQGGEYPILCGSDAHQPGDIGTAATFAFLASPTADELRKALANREGRMILGGGRLMEDLALHLLDIAENSIEAGAGSLQLELQEQPEADRLVLSVTDDGPGMSAGQLEKAQDPFYTTRTTRKVGMGLSLLAEAARAAGGDVTIDSQPGRGTSVRAVFQYSHIDRAPVGDIETTLMVLMAGHPDLRIRYRHTSGSRHFDLDSGDFAGLDLPARLSGLRAAIRAGEEYLRGPSGEIRRMSTSSGSETDHD